MSGFLPEAQAEGESSSREPHYEPLYDEPTWEEPTFQDAPLLDGGEPTLKADCPPDEGPINGSAQPLASVARARPERVRPASARRPPRPEFHGSTLAVGRCQEYDLPCSELAPSGGGRLHTAVLPGNLRIQLPMTDSDLDRVEDELAWLNRQASVTILSLGQRFMLALLDDYALGSERRRKRIRALKGKFGHVFWNFLDGSFVSCENDDETVRRRLLWMSLVGAAGDLEWYWMVSDYCKEVAAKTIPPLQLARMLREVAALSDARNGGNTPSPRDFFEGLAREYEADGTGS